MGAPVAEGGLGMRAEDGEIVGIMSENCSDYIALVHSCLMIATPFALISSYSTPFELKHALTLSKATSLFVDAKFLPAVLHVAKEVGLPLNKVFVLAGHMKGRKSLSDLVKYVKAKSMPTVAARQAKKDTLAYLVFSSGTSGLPKAVMISPGNIIYSLAQALVVQQAVAKVYTPPTPANPEGIPVTLAFLPLHHTYGLHAYCFRACLTQNTFVIMSKWDIELAFKAIPKYKVSTLMLVPSIVHQIVEHPKSKHVDWSSVISAKSGAAYLSPELAEKMATLVPKDSSLSEGASQRRSKFLYLIWYRRLRHVGKCK
jgi:acyl-CoA synthetase (AMP-forming)/AMP-acid ligase II